MFEDDKQKELRERLLVVRAKAEDGDPAANVILGDHFAEGVGVPQDFREALRCYRAAERLGSSAALIKIGDALLHGRGTPKYEKRAADYYRRASESEDQIDAAFGAKELSRCYVWGRGVGKDKDEATRWWRKAETTLHSSQLCAADHERFYTRPPLTEWAESPDTASAFFITDKDGHRWTRESATLAMRASIPFLLLGLVVGFFTWYTALVWLGVGAFLLFACGTGLLFLGFDTYTNIERDERYRKSDKALLEAGKAQEDDLYAQRPHGTIRNEGTI